MRGLLALLLLATAGCASPFEPEAPDAARLATERISYFHSAMTLAEAPEPNASAVRTGGFYESWAAGTDYPTWVGDPLGRDVVVTGANVTLFLQVTGPVVESRRFPDIMVYGGAGDAWMGFGSVTDVTSFQPGEVYEIDVELAMPLGGLWLAPGIGFGLKVVPVMLQQDERADVEILVGGNDTASRVAWTLAQIDVPASTPERGEATGELIGTIYTPVQAPTTSQRTPLPVEEGSAYVLAWMNTTENVGIPDVDLSIFAPNGDTIASSGTPTPREAIRIAGPNLRGGGEYGLVVTTAGSPRAEYKLEWLVGR